MAYVGNIRDIPPVDVATAGGETILDQEGDAMLANGHVLRDCLLNGNSDLNLCSEGLQRTGESPWDFRSVDRGLKLITTGRVWKR